MGKNVSLKGGFNSGFDLINFISLIAFFCSGVSSRTRSRSRQADSSTDMSLPDPRPVVAPSCRRQPARQPSLAPPPPQPPQPDQVPCNGNLLLAHYNPNHLRSSPCNQTKFQIICLQAIHQIIRDICIDKKYMTCSIWLENHLTESYSRCSSIFNNLLVGIVPPCKMISSSSLMVRFYLDR